MRECFLSITLLVYAKRGGSWLLGCTRQWRRAGRRRAWRRAFADWTDCLKLKVECWNTWDETNTLILWVCGRRADLETRRGQRCSFKQTAPRIGIKIPSVMLRRSPHAWLIMWSRTTWHLTRDPSRRLSHPAHRDGVFYFLHNIILIRVDNLFTGVPPLPFCYQRRSMRVLIALYLVSFSEHGQRQICISWPTRHFAIWKCQEDNVLKDTSISKKTFRRSGDWQLQTQFQYWSADPAGSPSIWIQSSGFKGHWTDQRISFNDETPIKFI